MSNEQAVPSLRSLEDKLQLVAGGLELDLTPEEAIIYGADYADEYFEDATKQKEDRYGYQ